MSSSILFSFYDGGKTWCVCACVRVTSPRWQREPMRSLEDSKFGVLLHGSGAFPATGRAGERNGIDGESVGGYLVQ